MKQLLALISLLALMQPCFGMQDFVQAAINHTEQTPIKQIPMTIVSIPFPSELRTITEITVDNCDLYVCLIPQEEPQRLEVLAPVIGGEPQRDLLDTQFSIKGRLKFIGKLNAFLIECTIYLHELCPITYRNAFIAVNPGLPHEERLLHLARNSFKTFTPKHQSHGCCN